VLAVGHRNHWLFASSVVEQARKLDHNPCKWQLPAEQTG